ncbi:MAG TPA: hypothetical protein PLP17_08375, partial [Oligoflexia bacterium]|nr:hypothetical protein [Oligoflexia bacterium]
FGKTLAVSRDDTTTTITTDGTVALPPKGLIGLAFNPDTNQQQTFTILDNTATTITIPKTPVAAVNAEYSALYRFDNVFLRRGAWVVLGDKLLVQTKLQLAERSVLTHYDATPVFSSRLELEAGSIEITADSSINASQRGYPGGLHEGNISCTAVSAPGVTGAQQRSGGSYGGLGYPESGAPNAVYGNITEPKHLGSGGSCGGGYFGGDGGGSVQVVAGSLVVDGLIAADGQTGEGNDAGSGAGGSINIRAVSFTGSGTVRANGGAYQVGGGGGRVAMRYQTLGLGAAQIQAIGGQVSGTRDGGAGTLFLKHDSEPDGELIIDGQGNAPVANLSIIPDGYTFDRITLRNKAYAVADYPLQVNGAVSLLGESLLTHTTRRENGLAIQAASMFVDATSSINVQGRGYLGGYVTGNSSCNGETISGQPGSQERSGGSYGGLGFTQSGAGPNATYGDPRNPVEIGSGGSCGGGYAGGNGGGRVNISASGTVQIDGLVTADGNPGSGNNAGSGSGGAVKIAAGTLSGNGRITANGGGYQLGAGGGRVAVRYGTLDFDTSRFEVKGGQAGNENGGNGTLYLKSSAQANGDLIIDGLNTDTPVNLSPIPGGYTFDNITLRNKARVTADSMLKVAGTLTLSAGSLLTHTRGLESGITIRTLDLVVDASSKIDATGRGYLGGCRGALGTRGETLGGLAGARERSGASYGGLGFNLSGATNP